jgi:NAD(P)-dependent dehydrogenase (short-subunit alcohol dehydrogenase family)
MFGMDVRGRVLAITGASSGIGAATAIEAARAGMRVAISGRRKDRLEEVATRIAAAGGEARVFLCDVDHDEQVRAFVEATLKDFGRLDAVFANSGYGILAPVAQSTDAEVRAIFETNFHGTLRLIRAALPILRANAVPAAGRFRGHILICSSAASRIAPPLLGAYAATKAAQHMIAIALRAELAPDRIAVTSVHPIGTRTEFAAQMGARMGRAGTAADSTTPDFFRQSQEHVARTIVRAMRRRNPPPEVWPSPATRFGLALVSAFPRLGAWAMRKQARRIAQKS